MTFKKGAARSPAFQAGPASPQKGGRRLAGPGPGQAERSSACGLKGRKRRPFLQRRLILAPIGRQNPRRPLIIFYASGRPLSLRARAAYEFSAGANWLLYNS